jgi:tRNA dimethylallyltransferase
MLKRLIFIVGPTAAGKTQAAVYLAKKLNAEIISVDSMQVYKGMPILTSKPSMSLRKRIKHYLIDTVPASKEYNASQYCKDVLKKVELILKKSKTPIFVGGTGLYVSMLVDGIFEEERPHKSIRKSLYALEKKYGSSYLYKRLQRVDHEAALKIHPNDSRRIVRALEIFQSTGKPISFLQKQRKGLRDRFDVRIFCLDMNRQELYRRIDLRVEKMLKEGLVNEVKKLSKKRLSRTALCAIGIKEIRGFLNGEYDLAEAKRLMQRNSRRYAKRQLTWFRKDKKIKWIRLTGKEKPAQVAAKIWKKLY